MTLKELNQLPEEECSKTLFNCCGSTSWVNEMLEKRPFYSETVLKEQAVAVFCDCTEKDWMEAFAHHPRLGNRKNLEKKFAATGHWAEEEQSGTAKASKSVLAQLELANQDYEKKFGFTYILCATGRSASFMLESLQDRLSNQRAEELNIAMEEQNKITKLRLEKLLS